MVFEASDSSLVGLGLRLGVHVRDVNEDLADYFGLDQPRGALISAIRNDSPSEAGAIYERHGYRPTHRTVVSRKVLEP